MKPKCSEFRNKLDDETVSFGTFSRCETAFHDVKCNEFVTRLIL